MTQTSVLLLPLIITAFIVGGYAYNQTQVRAQSDIRERTVVKRGKRAPVKLLTVKTNGQKVRNGKLAGTDEDWLRDFAVEVFNSSGKPITFIQLELYFPRSQGDPRPGGSYSVWYGDNPFHYESASAMPALRVAPIQPGDTIELKLTDTDYLQVRSLLNQIDHAAAAKVDIQVNVIGFSDGTAWTGSLMERKPGGGWKKQNISQARKKNRNPLLAHHPLDPPCGSDFILSAIGCPPQPWPECKADTWAFSDIPPIAGYSRTTETVAPCRFLGTILMCTSAQSNRVEDCGIPCGNEFDSCLMNSDCCGGVCNAGVCGNPSEACIPPCPIGYECFQGICTDMTPIVVDVLGNGFELTSAADGVNFDFNGDGQKQRISWLASDSDDVWLALDRNDNDIIDSGQELFGNFTPQPAPALGQLRNGFLALAAFDQSQQGGNEDGQINRSDAIFGQLRLWRDVNHNGISETTELFLLPQLGIDSLETAYKTAKRTDQFGNRFRYRGKVRSAKGTQAGRWAWDVFLVGGP